MVQLFSVGQIWKQIHAEFRRVSPSSVEFRRIPVKKYGKKYTPEIGADGENWRLSNLDYLESIYEFMKYRQSGTKIKLSTLNQIIVVCSWHLNVNQIEIVIFMDALHSCRVTSEWQRLSSSWICWSCHSWNNCEFGDQMRKKGK